MDLLHPAGPDPTMPFTGVRDDPNSCVRQLVSQRAVVSKTDHTAHQTDRRITAASEWEHQAAELMLVCCLCWHAFGQELVRSIVSEGWLGSTAVLT